MTFPLTRCSTDTRPIADYDHDRSYWLPRHTNLRWQQMEQMVVLGA